MNKSLLSGLMDDAAFPVVMLAVAVSQMNVEPNRKDTLRRGGRVPGNGRWTTGFNKTRQNMAYSPISSPPVADRFDV